MPAGGWAVVRGPPLLALALLALLAGCSAPGGGDGDEDGAAAPALPPPEARMESGRLSAAEPNAEHIVGIQADGHSRFAVTLVLRTSLPENELRLNVTGPSTPGREVDTSPFLYVYPGANPTLSFAQPASGEWTARVHLASGSTAAYEVHWCADGADRPGPAGNLACHRSYG